ncbi:MAG TPA: cytochrome c [Gammaproteobacteria bacterium]|nr:cytochrome c [Gammaproteobacteria bacterium]
MHVHGAHGGRRGACVRRLLLFAALSGLMLSAVADALPLQRQAALRDLVHEDCGACHGMRLTGGLGPALTPQALQGKDHDFLYATISEGRPGTPMPPWGPLLTRPEIDWIVDYLKHPEGRP